MNGKIITTHNVTKVAGAIGLICTAAQLACNAIDWKRDYLKKDKTSSKDKDKK